MTHRLIRASRRVLAVAILAAATSAPLGAPLGAQPACLARAHAHNDYQQARPLLGALERGVASVEVDVHLVGGRLLVTHHRDSVVAERTLEALYLEPLREWARARGGRVLRGTRPLLLLVDVKSDSVATWAALDAVLRRYPDLFGRVDGDSVREPGVVRAVVSGHRAIGALRAARPRLAALDGRLSDLGASSTAAPPALMPLVSDDWKRVTAWKGRGAPPPALRARLDRLVRLAHQRGRLLRFWGTPDAPVVWQLLHDAGVDLIGADDLAALDAFLRGRGDGVSGCDAPLLGDDSALPRR